MSVLCSGGSLGSKPAFFLVLAIASLISDESLTATRKSEINRLEQRLRIGVVFAVGRVTMTGCNDIGCEETDNDLRL